MTPEAKEDELALIVARIVAEIKIEFGPFHFLPGEDPRRYDRILFDVVWAEWPADFIGRMLCRDIANGVWNELRLDRLNQVTYDLLQEKIERHERRLRQPALLRSETEEDENFGIPKVKAGHELVTLDCAEEEEPLGRSLQEMASVLRTWDDLKTTNAYRRNGSLQMMRQYKPRGMPSYMIRKAHNERAQAEMAERDARIQLTMETTGNRKSEAPEAAPPYASKSDAA